jgi:hypothetical protein
MSNSMTSGFFDMPIAHQEGHTPIADAITIAVTAERKTHPVVACSGAAMCAVIR